MDATQVKDIVESIKTLNLNINDATTQKIADQVLPVVKYYLIFNFTKFMITTLLIAGISYAVYRIIMSIINKEIEIKNENNSL